MKSRDVPGWTPRWLVSLPGEVAGETRDLTLANLGYLGSRHKPFVAS